MNTNAKAVQFLDETTGCCPYDGQPVTRVVVTMWPSGKPGLAYACHGGHGLIMPHDLCAKDRWPQQQAYLKAHGKLEYLEPGDR